MPLKRAFFVVLLSAFAVFFCVVVSLSFDFAVFFVVLTFVLLLIVLIV